MHQQPTSKKRELIAALAVLIVVVAIVGAATVSAKKKPAVTVAAGTANAVSSGAATSGAAAGTATSTSNTASPAPASAQADAAAAAPASGAYKDGSYTAVGSYYSPDGPETISVEVTLKNSVITETSARSGGGSHDSQEYQQRFIAGYKQLVVSKSVDAVALSRVSGASLTPQGFNDALNQIKQQAQQNA